MSPRWTKQTKFGEMGNCMAHALAGLFDVPVNETQPISDAVQDGWATQLRAFAESKGYAWLILSPTFDYIQNTLYIACGPTNRGTTHCVVMKNKELFWDPHPDNTGLIKVESIWVFIPKDPANWINRAELNEKYLRPIALEAIL